jgi:hypothetical protein
MLLWFVVGLPKLLGKILGNLSAILLAFGTGGKVILAPLVWLAGMIPAACVALPLLILIQRLAPSTRLDAAVWVIPLATILSHPITFDITRNMLIVGALAVPVAVLVMRDIDYVEYPSETFQTCSWYLYWGVLVVGLIGALLAKLFGWQSGVANYTVAQIIVTWLLFLALGGVVVWKWTQGVLVFAPEDKAQWLQELAAKRKAQRDALFVNVGSTIRYIFWWIFGLAFMSVIITLCIPLVSAYYEHDSDKAAGMVEASYTDLTKAHFGALFATVGSYISAKGEQQETPKPTLVRKTAVVLG